MYWRFHGDIIAGEQMPASKNTQSSLKGLFQSTVLMATYSNDFKGANLKWSKIRIQCSSSSFFLSFFNQSSAVTRKVLRSKLPQVAREFSGGGAFALGIERNCDITPALFDRGGTPFCRCTCADDASTASAWEAPRNKKSKLKRFLKQIYTNKEQHIPQHCYISHNHPYTSSSDMLGGTVYARWLS